MFALFLGCHYPILLPQYLFFTPFLNGQMAGTSFFECSVRKNINRGDTMITVLATLIARQDKENELKML